MKTSWLDDEGPWGWRDALLIAGLIVCVLFLMAMAASLCAEMNLR